MPGTLYHLYFAKLTHEWATAAGIDLDLTNYAAGNLLPDETKRKERAHFYRPDRKSHFFVPNLTHAAQHYMQIEDVSLRLGVIAHLYLDKFFTTRVIAYNFVYFPARDRIYPRNGYSFWWTTADFFSFEKGIYRVYSECNPLLLLRENISMEWIRDNVPRELPLTGLRELDDRNSATWLDLLEKRLVKPPVYTGGILTYQQLVVPIRNAARVFVDKMISD